MRTVTDGRLELMLDRPCGAPAESKASNPRHNGAGFKILNCTLGNTRSRGILIKADHGLIEGNTISGCGMSAISIGPEYYWNEADTILTHFLPPRCWRRWLRCTLFLARLQSTCAEQWPEFQFIRTPTP